MVCEHNKIYYIGQMVQEDDDSLPKQLYEQYKDLDLYNCVRCDSTIAINRNDISKLEKEIIEYKPISEALNTGR